MFNRREFLSVGAAWAAALPMMNRAFGQDRRFSRGFAPHLGMFRHHAGNDAVDQVTFLADEGFHALEDSGLRAKPVALQSRIGEELARRQMTMGLFVAVADFARPTFASGSVELRNAVLRELRSAIETARRVGGRYLAIIPGKRVHALSHALQMRHAAESLRYCADLCERHDLTLLLEPIDLGADSSRLFLRTANQAAELCRCVGRPSCRLLVDVCQQATAGHDVATLLAQTRDVLGYVQLGDWPGRKEPGTGDLDFARLLTLLDGIGYRGLLGMEHGKRLPGREGERALIAAYRALDEAAQRPIAASRAAARHRSTSS
jgi:hydroxypyruvate isomerase